MKEGFFVNCHRKVYFASYLTFFILKKVNLVTKQEMVVKKNSGIREAGKKIYVGKKKIKGGGKKAIMVINIRKGDKKAILVKDIKEVGKKNLVTVN